MAEESEGIIVEALESGKIVKVTEAYARREGLLVLRRPPIAPAQATLSTRWTKKKEDREGRSFIGLDELRKPLKAKEGGIAKELIDNFHWELLRKRKARALTRKQVAAAINESENDLKLMESGIAPMNNFILVNKLESYYNINLRKNKVASAPPAVRDISVFNVEGMKSGDSKKPLREIIGEKKNEGKKEGISGGEIEIEFEES